MEKLTKARFTNLGKIIYPELELTKSDIIHYYIRVATRILPFLKKRALVRTRYPDGIHGESFYEKDTPQGKPEWVETFTKYSKTRDKDTHYIVCNDLDSLLYLANLASIELHIPLSNIPNTEKPDMVLFDLDPEPPAGLREAMEAAFLVKEKLEDRGYKSYTKVSGKKGVHVVIPIYPGPTFDETKEFVHQVGKEISKYSDKVVSERRQTKNPGTVLIDYPQNSERATMIAPYSLRALREATVSTPLEWSELTTTLPFDYNIYSMEYRKKDPWNDFFNNQQELK